MVINVEYQDIAGVDNSRHPIWTFDSVDSRYRVRLRGKVILYPIADLPTLVKAVGIMHDLRGDENIENARTFLQQSIRGGGLRTSTKIDWQPDNAPDNILHGYYNPNKREIKANIKGNSGKVEDVLEEEACRALTGTDPQSLKRYFDWINEANYTEITRIRKGYQGRVESLVGFHANYDRFRINCEVPLVDDTFEGFEVRIDDLTEKNPPEIIRGKK